jgi:hypothetical protein
VVDLIAFYQQSHENTFYRFVVVSLSWQVPDNSVAENLGLFTFILILNGEIEKNISVR